MPAPEIIHQLVARFEENREAYHSGKYNEAQLRQEFLDKFFEALGWDIYNRNGFSPEYRDVVIEDSLQIEGASKAPDYAFKIGKERKFYVEAKKPAVNIEYDIHPAYQLKRYAWNAHMPLSILTDFEELAVYNCKNKPAPTDSAATGRDKFYKYTDYIEKWDEIAGIFSRDAVWKGSFDRFVESSKGKRGTTEVDDAILKDIEEWRLLLARNIALRNPQVADEHQLNYAVQMTIDRILFLRICEDRGIEPEEQFKTMASRPGIYAQMVELFRRADMKYNSGLFHFSKEKGNEGAADTFTPSLKIDDKVLKEIISSIYYPCPYIFKEIPVEILGQVYEQFLGKVIRLTAGHQAKVEEKPEVRKAGGVYYTPKYIVDYIVRNTVGKLLEGKTPAEASELKIVDPACGSGSFLLGAYQYLLDWHMKWYTSNDPEKWVKGKNPAVTPANGGGWKLTTAKKKEILVNNIHGVDIDAQAVEVTKLSLLLKVLEEESGQLSLGLERVLPDLGRNIQCGNSLIGPDYYANEQMTIFDSEEQYRVNAFDWQTAFPSIFAKGGFDVVIGNPPYGIVFEEFTKPYLEKKFSAFIRNNDTYSAFIEESLFILRQKGIFGFIIPNTFLLGPYFNNLKNIILTNTTIHKIIDFGLTQIFNQPNVFTSLLFFEKYPDSDKKTQFIKIHDIKKFPEELMFEELDRNTLMTLKWSPQNLLFSKLVLHNPKLEELAWVKDVGLNYWTEGRGKTRGGSIADRAFYEGVKLNVEDKPYLKGRDVSRYRIEFSQHWLRHNYKKLLDPKIDTLRFSPEFLLQEKIVYRQTADHIIASLDLDKMLSDKTVHIIVVREQFKTKLDLPYLLGLLDSRLLSHLYKEISQEEGRTFAQVKVFRMKELPIRIIDFSDPADVKFHERMVALVERMLELHKRAVQTPQEQERLAREIASTDREIDALVYQLYGLTEEEVKIVEG